MNGTRTGNGKKIVVATDFSKCSDAAFTYAVSLAPSLDAEVIAVFVNNADDFALAVRHDLPVNLRNKKMLAKEARQFIADRFQRLFNSYGGGYQRLRSAVLTGNAAAQILRFVKKEKADLLVTGTRSRSPLKRLVLGSTAMRLIQNAPCPVVVVGQNWRLPGNG